MELKTTAQVREALRAVPRAEWDALAEQSGVPRSTMEKIAYGVTANPSFEATANLIHALEQRAQDSPTPS